MKKVLVVGSIILVYTVLFSIWYYRVAEIGRTLNISFLRALFLFGR